MLQKTSIWFYFKIPQKKISASPKKRASLKEYFTLLIGNHLRSFIMVFSEALWNNHLHKWNILKSTLFFIFALWPFSKNIIYSFFFFLWAWLAWFGQQHLFLNLDFKFFKGTFTGQVFLHVFAKQNDNPYWGYKICGKSMYTSSQ
jgi:hypothetical protein